MVDVLIDGWWCDVVDGFLFLVDFESGWKKWLYEIMPHRSNELKDMGIGLMF